MNAAGLAEQLAASNTGLLKYGVRNKVPMAFHRHLKDRSVMACEVPARRPYSPRNHLNKPTALFRNLHRMVDHLRPPHKSPEADPHATLGEWARKHYLRNGMRADALPPEQFKALDERLLQWTSDRQREGKLPPDWELGSKWAALAGQFLNNRDEAKPIFTAEEQRDVDASRAASALRDRLDDKQDPGSSLRHVSVQYAVLNDLGEFDARRRVTGRFEELYGRPASEYAKDQRSGERSGKESKEQPVLSAELGWEKYEPAFRRWAAFNSMQYVAKRDGAITPREYAERQEYLRGWIADQQRQGKLPSRNEIRSRHVQLEQLMLPYQKQITRQEKQRMRSDGAYLAPPGGLRRRDKNQHRDRAALHPAAERLRYCRRRRLRQVAGSGQRGPSGPVHPALSLQPD